MRRHQALLSAAAAAGAAVLLLGVCSTTEPAAATVNGTKLERSAFEDQLQAYADNDAYVAQQSQQNQTVIGAGSSTVTGDFARSTLQSDILYTLVGEAVDDRNLTVADDVRSLSEQLVQQTYADSLASFPTSFVDDRVQETAELLTIALNLGGMSGLTDAQHALYDADPTHYQQRCVSHILSADDAGAQAVLDELATGADFGTVATEHSTDTSAATNKGVLGCFGPDDQQLDADFLAGAFAAPVGVPTKVTSQFGVHVVLVTSVEQQTFEEASNALVSDVLGQLGTPLNDFITKALKDADITVDDRYGRWDATQGLVLPGDVGDAPTTTSPTSPTSIAATSPTSAG